MLPARVGPGSDPWDDPSEELPPQRGEPLPAGWEEQVEPGSGMTYWISITDGETVFERPTEAAAGAGSAAPLPPWLPPRASPSSPSSWPAASAAAAASTAAPQQPRPVSAAASSADDAAHGDGGNPIAPPPPPPPSALATGPSAAPAAPASTAALASHTASRTGPSGLMSSVRVGLFGARPSGEREYAPRARRRIPTVVGRNGRGQWEAVVAAVTSPPARARPASVLGPFGSEAEAHASARHDAPPVWEDGIACTRCGQGFGLVRRRHHCRNCG